MSQSTPYNVASERSQAEVNSFIAIKIIDKIKDQPFNRKPTMKKLIFLLLLAIASTGCKNSTNTNVNDTGDFSKTALKNQEKYFMTSDSVKIRFKVAGQGEPCLYIHGGPGQGFDSFELMKGQNLEDSLTMIYFDQRGSGSSGKAADYHMDKMMSDIEGLRKNLGIEKFFLLAHSFGGIIATEYALRYPQHVKGVIMANVTLHFFNVNTTKEQIIYADSLLQKETQNLEIEKDSLLPIFLDLRQKLSEKHMGYRFLTDDINSIIKMETIDSLHPRIADFGMDVITRQDEYPEYYKNYAPETKNVKVPVLIITGNEDHAVGINHYKSFEFPDQQTAKLDGGHLLYYENNKEFLETIWNFVYKQSDSNENNK